MKGSKSSGRASLRRRVMTGIAFVAAVSIMFSALVVRGTNQLTYEKSLDSYLMPSFGQFALYNGSRKNESLSNAANATDISNGEKNATKVTSDHCFSMNSVSWLMGPRFGNIPLEIATDLLLLNDIRPALEQTLCHAESSFLNSNFGNENLNVTAFRLVYLAYYLHQHEPAWKETRHRLQHCSSADLSQYNLGNFDYECPDAKFLVVPLTGSAGLGAVMRLTVTNALMVGMATNRIVLFVNNAPAPPILQQKWSHVSCQRRDMQCFFLPVSPCVLTQKELDDAYVMEKSQIRGMFRTGNLTGEHAEDRVVIAKIDTRPHRLPPNLRERVVNTVKQHVLPLLSVNDGTTSVLQQAVDLIYEIEPLRNGSYYYFGHNSKVHHAAVFYAMRPLPEYAKRLNEMIEESLPSNFDPSAALGLPIRGSDKCIVESECLSFDQHMKAIASLQKQHQVYDNEMNGGAHVIVTTEDERVMRNMRRYNSSAKDTTTNVTYRFITNRHDVMQGTGNAKYFVSSGSDDIVLSSVAALKLQLHAKYAIGNCCSNFHLLLFDFIKEGCGPARPNAVATCLQELDDPSLRVCCNWDKSDECEAKRQAQ